MFQGYFCRMVSHLLWQKSCSMTSFSLISEERQKRESMDAGRLLLALIRELVCKARTFSSGRAPSEAPACHPAAAPLWASYPASLCLQTPVYRWDHASSLFSLCLFSPSHYQDLICFLVLVELTSPSRAF